MIERKGTQARYCIWKNLNSFIHQFAINNNALCLPPKILYNHCFQLFFSRVLQSSQEKSKTKVMQNLGGVNKQHYGLCENGERKKNFRPEKNAYIKRLSPTQDNYK